MKNRRNGGTDRGMDAWMKGWMGATDAWVDGGTLPRRPPVGRRRQRGFHGVHGAHQQVWAGSSEAAAGTAGRRHRLSLGLREAVEGWVRGSRPRRGRGGGQPIGFATPQPPRPGLGVRPAAGTGRRPARAPPLRAAPPRRPTRRQTSLGRRALGASPAPVGGGNRGDFPGKGRGPPLGTAPRCPGYFQPGPAPGARGVTGAFCSSRRRGRAAETGSPRGKTRRGDHPW